jgi:hypothetical protein
MPTPASMGEMAQPAMHGPVTPAAVVRSCGATIAMTYDAAWDVHLHQAPRSGRRRRDGELGPAVCSSRLEDMRETIVRTRPMRPREPRRAGG